MNADNLDRIIATAAELGATIALQRVGQISGEISEREAFRTYGSWLRHAVEAGRIRAHRTGNGPTSKNCITWRRYSRSGRVTRQGPHSKSDSIMKKELTPAELQRCCNFLNWLHVRLWTALAIIVAVLAVIFNPGHLLTAALLLLFSRAEWDTRDINALTK